MNKVYEDDATKALELNRGLVLAVLPKKKTP